MRRALAVLTLLCACTVRPPIREAVTVDLTENRDTAKITVTTEIGDVPRERTEMVERVDKARRDIAAGRDEWAARFNAVDKQWDRVAIENKWGSLVRAERSATIARDDLQRFFADTGLVVQTTRGDGWYEVSMFSNSSSRATRRDRERVLAILDDWCNAAAEYFRTLDDLYAYLEKRSTRADALFGTLFSSQPVELTDDEQDLIKRFDASSEAITKLMEEAEQSGVTLDEQFDRVFNPFPAPMTVKTPGDTLVIERSGLLDAALALENKWATPNPLAMILRAEYEGKDLPSAADIVKVPRKWTKVTAAELRQAFIERLQPQPTHRVRFNER